MSEENSQQPESPASGDEINGRYARYVLFVLIIVYIFNFIDRQILSILMESIKLDLGLSDKALGFLAGFAFAAFYATMGIPIALARLSACSSLGRPLASSFPVSAAWSPRPAETSGPR